MEGEQVNPCTIWQWRFFFLIILWIKIRNIFFLEPHLKGLHELLETLKQLVDHGQEIKLSLMWSEEIYLHGVLDFYMITQVWFPEPQCWSLCMVPWMIPECRARNRQLYMWPKKTKTNKKRTWSLDLNISIWDQF